jgi:hypothetical protein
MGAIGSTAKEIGNIATQFTRASVDLCGILALKGAAVLAGFQGFFPYVAGIISGRLAASTIPAMAGFNWAARFVAGRAPSVLGQIVTAAIDMSLFAIILNKPILTVMVAYLPAALAMNFLIRPAVAWALRKIPGLGWLGNILAPGAAKKPQALAQAPAQPQPQAGTQPQRRRGGRRRPPQPQFAPA